MTSRGDEQARERDQRWQRVRDFLRNRELDALVVAGPSSHTSEPLDRYLSNWIPGCIVVFPLEGDPTLLNPFVPQVLAFGPDTPDEELPWVRDIRSGARGSSVVTVIQEKGLEKARIGVVGLSGMRTDWEGWIPYRTWDRVARRLTDCTFEDVTTEFGESILVKSEEELSLVRQAARALELASEEMLKKVRPGVTELELYGAIQNVLTRSGVFSPMSIIRSGPKTISWGGTPWLFGVGSPRVFEAGDVVLAEIFAWKGGLEAQVQMAVAIPPVSPQDAECARLARGAYEAGLENLRPGNTFADVVGAMEAVLDRPDVWYLTPLIHSMNPMACIGRTGKNIEALPGQEFFRKLGSQIGTSRIRGGDVVLEPGMVFEFEPNACLERHRVNIGGTAVVTDNGAEPLNEIATQMRVAGEGH